VFVGRRFQRKHGLGCILGGFVRQLVLPFFKSKAKSMLGNVARTGIEVADDVIHGRKFTDSVKNRIPVGMKRGIDDIAFQSPSVKRRRGTKSSRARRGHRRDIFSH